MRVGTDFSTGRSRPFVRLAAIFAILLSAGCTSGPRTLPVPIPFTSGDGLTKKVAVLPFEVQSVYADPRARSIAQQTLIDSLEEECSGVNFVLAPVAELPVSLEEVPRLEDGAIDNFQLAMLGRRQGLNAVLIGSLQQRDD